MLGRALLVVAVLAPAGAGAAEDAPRQYGNLRFGASTAIESRHVELCGEGAPLPWLSIEACGNGSQLLHHDPIAAISHYRVMLRLATLRDHGVFVEPRLGVGFAELEVGPDELGFDFGGTGPHGASTTGAEGTFSVRLLVPVSPAWEIVVELRTALAWMPHAPELVRPMDPWQLTGGLSVGVGF
jgi:hypothetical protein